LFSAAVSYNNILYLWSQRDTYNPGYSLTNISSISLSKQFAVMLDGNQKAYTWGSIMDDSGSRPFYEVEAPTELEGLKSKEVKFAVCGDDFAIAIGKDMAATTKVVKKQGTKKSQRNKRSTSAHKNQQAFFGAASDPVQETASFDNESKPMP